MAVGRYQHAHAASTYSYTLALSRPPRSPSRRRPVPLCEPSTTLFHPPPLSLLSSFQCFTHLSYPSLSLSLTCPPFIVLRNPSLSSHFNSLPSPFLCLILPFLPSYKLQLVLPFKILILCNSFLSETSAFYIICFSRTFIIFICVRQNRNYIITLADPKEGDFGINYSSLSN